MTRPRPRAGPSTPRRQEAISSFFEKCHSFFSYRPQRKAATKMQSGSAAKPSTYARRASRCPTTQSLSKPLAKFAVAIDQTVVRAASNPEQVQFFRGRRVQRGRFFVKLFGDASRAERRRGHHKQLESPVFPFPSQAQGTHVGFRISIRSRFSGASPRPLSRNSGANWLRSLLVLLR